MQPENSYSVIVTADNGASSQEESYTRFSLLEAEEAARVSREVEELQQQPLQGKGKALALAHLYRRKGLQSEAIEVLAKLVAGGSETTAVHLLLAEVYQDVDLSFLAQEGYLQALELAKEEGNWEAQGISQVELGTMEEAIDELQLAAEFYEGALASYRVLGDEEKVEELEQKLVELGER